MRNFIFREKINFILCIELSWMRSNKVDLQSRRAKNSRNPTKNSFLTVGNKINNNSHKTPRFSQKLVQRNFSTMVLFNLKAILAKQHSAQVK